MEDDYILMIDPGTGEFSSKDADHVAPDMDMNLYLARRLQVVTDSIERMALERHWELPDVRVDDVPVSLIVGDRFEPMMLLEKMMSDLEGGKERLSVHFPDISMGYWMADLQRTGMIRRDGPFYETARTMLEDILVQGMGYYGKPVELVSRLEARIPLTLNPLHDTTTFVAGYKKSDIN